MKVTTKLLIATIFVIIIFFICINCEKFIYYLVLSQCNWPHLNPKNEDPKIRKTNENHPLRFMLISDTHLQGSIKGYWLDKVIRDWEMKTMFQIAINIHKPDVVFVLGDLTVEGEYCSDSDLEGFIDRFYNKIFTLPSNIQMYVVAGNHDTGFHNYTNAYLTKRFEKGFKAADAELLTLRGNHFVLLNSVTLHGDGCSLCADTELELSKIEDTLKCTKGEINCDPTTNKLRSYSRPIILQHFPLYRKSDEECDEPDEAPYKEKHEKFVETWDCLSKNATEKLLYQLNPRLVFDGHTHHGCTRNLSNGGGVEITVPSFNWRFKNNPSYELVVATPNNYALKKCLMPRESSTIIRCTFGVSCLFFGMLYWYCRSRRRQKRFFIV